MGTKFKSILSLVITLNFSLNHAQLSPIQIVETNTSSFPFTVRVVSTMPNIHWHDIVKIDGNDENNTQTLRFQFVGDGNSNAMSGFDTTVYLLTDNAVFDLCVYVDWMYSPIYGYPPNDVVWDSICLENEVLNLDSPSISFKAPAIFPNPAQDHFFIVFDENADVSLPITIGTREVKVYDLSGVLQFTREMKANDYVLEIKTENMAKGMYLVTISANGREISTQKVAVR